MIANPRGPYSRILWFCNDGTTQPPLPNACDEHGGGRQHGEYSQNRARLAQLGWSVGTVFAALTLDELSDEDRRQQRLRELALERYLMDIDDGWVMRGARTYRGAVQVEAEERAGRELLLQLLARTDWLQANYLLVRESMRVIPHGAGSADRTRDIRRAATELADRDAAFGPLRVEIHGTPSAGTADRVRAWAVGERPPEIRVEAQALASALDTLYGAAGRRDRLAAVRDLLAARPATAALAAQAPLDPTQPAAARVAALAATLANARATILAPETRPAVRLLLLDMTADVENELALAAAEVLDDGALPRGELLTLAARLAAAAHGSGLLTDGEHAALASLEQDPAATEISLERYAAAVQMLRRVPQWAVGSVRYTFAEPLVRYSALDPRAAAFVDDQLRGSALVPLAEVTRRLGRDVAELTGVTQDFDGQSGLPAFGLNTGLATGRLRILETAADVAAGGYERSDIVVLPETTAELEPVAGIVTLGEGNPLSHVQLLARNFGIPNVAIVPNLLARLRPLAGREVLIAVAGDGSLVLRELGAVDAATRTLLAPAARESTLTVARPNLAVRAPISLADLNGALSGKVVGPKAANLGDLARAFPGRVAPALAVPFGIFAEHVHDAAGEGPGGRLTAAYAEHRAGLLGDDELDLTLAGVRDEIAALAVTPERRAALEAAMAAEFGSPGTYGVFVRSDTNVEDLPEFTGAGLSLTLPNVVGTEPLMEAIPRVWASVLSPRAIAWRSSLLTNPEEVYASVLLMRSVPATKSGVLVTTDLAGAADGLTVSTAWGIGGAVAGEAAETLVLRESGAVLVSEAKTAYRRALDRSGGLAWKPAADGPVLSPAEQQALRALADEVGMKFTPARDERGLPRPWDIEFGFVDGELTLFQIRPLVERGPQLADRVVAALRTTPPRPRVATVALGEPPAGGSLGGP